MRFQLLAPGHRYLGPGNKLNNGRPANKNDKVAQMHDIHYGRIARKAKAKYHPYFRYSPSDDHAIEEWDDTGWGPISKRIFRAKRSLFESGIIGGTSDYERHKRQRESVIILNDKGLAGTISPKRKQTARMSLLRGQRKRERDDLGVDPRSEHRVSKALRVSDEPVASLLNSTATTQMAEGQGSGKADGNLKETPLDDPYVVYRGPPQYTFASLPYLRDEVIRDLTTYSRDHTFRMTSPLDCLVANMTTDMNTGTGTTTVTESMTDVGDVSHQYARWFNYYAGMYNYYHVVSARYTVFVENLGGKPLWVYCMFSNEQSPPRLATNQDMQLWNDVKFHYLNRPYASVLSQGETERTDLPAGNNEIREGTGAPVNAPNFETGNNVTSRGGSITCAFSGEYKPGDFNHEIILDDKVENWTAVGQNPKLSERLIIRVRPQSDSVGVNDTAVYGDTLYYRIRVNINYLVEFKELKQQLRFPIQRQPITVTLHEDPTSNG